VSLRELSPDPHLATSTDKLLDRFYVPALRASVSYDRGVGFFTSSWLRLAASGLAGLAANGGRARIIASPMLDAQDCAAISQGAEARADSKLKQALELEISDLERDLTGDTLAALAWMVADGLLEFRIAVPTADLDGDFHDKFGILRDAEGNAIAFHGSPNDSARAFRNYESVSLYYSWIDDREASRVAGHQARFDLLWNNGDINLRVYELPDAVRRNLVAFTEKLARPYDAPRRATERSGRWKHQTDAMAAFFKARHGILEMATGTGKTRTALNILTELEVRSEINTAIVCAQGTDLLDQWHGQLVERSPWPIYRAYGSHKEVPRYLSHAAQSVMLCSRRELAAFLPRLPREFCAGGLIICDEVHGMGAASMVAALSGEIAPFAYRLGLSATPDREYDSDGRAFIEREIGPVIFEFGLSDAILQGVLCPFDYIPLGYSFSADDREAIRQAFRRHAARARSGEPVSDEALYRDLARVRKLSREKLPLFTALVDQRPQLLSRSIIFVEEADYGRHVQDTLMRHHVDYHTYYAEDDRSNLRRFADGSLDCLITCHRLSEGIDIQSVNNVILFSSARARLETVQRLGRCLRIDPRNPEKRATVVDFIRTDEGRSEETNAELSADRERATWLTNLSRVR
jgi:superfamily II DNA or RNA helicase